MKKKILSLLLIMVAIIPFAVKGLPGYSSDDKLFIYFAFTEESNLGYGYTYPYEKLDVKADSQIVDSIYFVDKNGNPIPIQNLSNINGNANLVVVIDKNDVPSDGVYIKHDNNDYAIFGRKEGITKNSTMMFSTSNYVSKNKLADYVDGDILYLVWNCDGNVCYSDELYTRSGKNTYINQSKIKSGNNDNPTVDISTLTGFDTVKWFALSYLDISVRVAEGNTKGLFNRHLLGEDCRVTWNMLLEALEDDYSSFNFVNNAGGFQQDQTEREVREVKNAIVANSESLDETHAIVPNKTGRYKLYIHDDEYPVPVEKEEETTKEETKEEKKKTTKNAKTGDPIMIYVGIGVVSLIAIVGATIYLKKNK